MRQLIFSFVFFFALIWLVKTWTHRAENTEVLYNLPNSETHSLSQSKPPVPPRPMKAGKIEAAIEAVLARLPDTAKIEASPSFNVHQEPKELIPTAIALADLKTEFLQRPELYPNAISFYERCVRKTSVLLSVRALCLHDLVEVSKEQKHPVSLAGYPPELIRILKKVY